MLFAIVIFPSSFMYALGEGAFAIFIPDGHICVVSDVRTQLLLFAPLILVPHLSLFLRREVIHNVKGTTNLVGRLTLYE